VATDIAAKLLPPLARFLEATRRAEERRRVAVLEKRMARQVARWFVAQGETVVERLEPHLASRFDDNAALFVQESIAPSDWLWILSTVLEAGAGELAQIVDVFAGSALMAGAGAVLDEFDEMRATFSLSNPRAVAWAEGHAARQVTRINDTTRTELNRLLTEAVDNGWSWTRTAQAIKKQFADFAGPPLFPSKKFRSRAEMVAAYEIGDAYEAGKQFAAEMAAGDFPMEKAWLSARDGRVRPMHQANDAQGWIPLDATFESGDFRPPTDPGCRCSLQYRRRPDDDAS
jgi:hypothetical protein